MIIINIIITIIIIIIIIIITREGYRRSLNGGPPQTRHFLS